MDGSRLRRGWSQSGQSTTEVEPLAETRAKIAGGCRFPGVLAEVEVVGRSSGRRVVRFLAGELVKGDRGWVNIYLLTVPYLACLGGGLAN